ncbi:MAG: hypothetical protein KDE47_07060, partial [Caldilineaceae bacterium]|nr:hypothetical protein [Caldilineaceae bacterium]
REYANMFASKNHYELPTYYNYGIWSAGFGAFRELIAHIKTTNWVLSGAIENFPLLYHYRLRPFSGERPAVDMAEHQKYVAYWNSNPNISQYILERAAAEYEAVLFLEHFVSVLEKWLVTHIDQLPKMVADMRDVITFLRQQGVIHFDIHTDNIMTDGIKPFLTDFGLVLDRQYDLSEAERAFFPQHTHYDYGEFLYSVAGHLANLCRSLPAAQKSVILHKYDIREGMPYREVFNILLDNIEALYADNVAPIDRNYVDTIINYRPVIGLMHDFATEMRSTNTKATVFNNRELQRLLRDTDFLNDKTH